MQHRVKRKVDSVPGCRWLAGSLLMLMLTMAVNAQPSQRPAAGHDALRQFAGEWTVAGEIVPASGQAPIPWLGTEQASIVGGFWLTSRMESSMTGMHVTGLTTIGYDPGSGTYVGTYVSSLDSILWSYTGKMDASGHRLVLETVGPSVLDPATTTTYRETLELIDENRKAFTSSAIDDKGRWVRLVTLEYQRVVPE